MVKIILIRMIVRQYKYFVGWNAAALAIQSFLSILFIPIYLHQLNQNDFAVICLIWTVVSLAGILDLGLSRFFTQRLALFVNTARLNRIRLYFTSAMIIIGSVSFATSMIATLAFYFYITNYYDKWVFGFDFYFKIFILINHGILINSMASALDGLHEIKISSILRVLSTIAYIALPIICFYITGERSIDSILSVSAIFRSLLLLSFLYIVRSYFVFAIKKSLWYHGLKVILVSRWLALSNISGFIANQVDRFVLGAVTSPRELGNYTIASDLIQKGVALLTITSASLLPVLAGDRKSHKKTNAAFVFQLPLLLFGVISVYLFSDWFLELWLQKNDNREIEFYLKIMIFGWVATGLGQILLTNLHASGFFSQVAKYHFIQVIIYIPFLCIFSVLQGAEGAAFIWSLRCVVDLIALYIIRVKNKK